MEKKGRNAPLRILRYSNTSSSRSETNSRIDRKVSLRLKDGFPPCRERKRFAPDHWDTTGAINIPRCINEKEEPARVRVVCGGRICMVPGSRLDTSQDRRQTVSARGIISRALVISRIGNRHVSGPPLPSPFVPGISRLRNDHRYRPYRLISRSRKRKSMGQYNIGGNRNSVTDSKISSLNFELKIESCRKNSFRTCVNISLLIPLAFKAGQPFTLFSYR